MYIYLQSKIEVIKKFFLKSNIPSLFKESIQLSICSVMSTLCGDFKMMDRVIKSFSISAKFASRSTTIHRDSQINHQVTKALSIQYPLGITALFSSFFFFFRSLLSLTGYNKCCITAAMLRITLMFWNAAPCWFPGGS